MFFPLFILNLHHKCLRQIYTKSNQKITDLRISPLCSINDYRGQGTYLECLRRYKHDPRMDIPAYKGSTTSGTRIIEETTTQEISGKDEQTNFLTEKPARLIRTITNLHHFSSSYLSTQEAVLLMYKRTNHITGSHVRYKCGGQKGITCKC